MLLFLTLSLSVRGGLSWLLLILHLLLLGLDASESIADVCSEHLRHEQVYTLHEAPLRCLPLPHQITITTADIALIAALHLLLL